MSHVFWQSVSKIQATLQMTSQAATKKWFLNLVHNMRDLSMRFRSTVRYKNARKSERGNIVLKGLGRDSLSNLQILGVLHR